MSRRRYLSTNISTDPRMADLARLAGIEAVLIYTWAIPHASDDATLPESDPRALLALLVPQMAFEGLVTRQHMERTVAAAEELGLWARTDNGRLTFPPSFYQYQSYVTTERRSHPKNGVDRTTPHNAALPRESAQDAEESRTAAGPAQNATSLKSKSKVSSSLEVSSSSKDQPPAAPGAPAPAPAREDDGDGDFPFEQPPDLTRGGAAAPVPDVHTDRHQPADEILYRIRLVGRELGDDHVPASISRAQNLLRKSRLDAARFDNLMKLAWHNTRKRQQQLDGKPIHTPMAYFFATLEGLSSEAAAAEQQAQNEAIE